MYLYLFTLLFLFESMGGGQVMLNERRAKGLVAYSSRLHDESSRPYRASEAVSVSVCCVFDARCVVFLSCYLLRCHCCVIVALSLLRVILALSLLMPVIVIAAYILVNIFTCVGKAINE